MDRDEFKRICVERIGEDKEYSSLMLDRFVFASFEAERLQGEIEADQRSTIKHTNKAGHTNEASSPKVRMWVLYSQEANKLGQLLGLVPTAKVGRPSKSENKTKGGFDTTTPMAIAK
jgi:hypothetical protein